MAIASKISNWFLWWVIYSLAGWIYETIIYSIYTGYFVNRGFLYGPIIPIYATGALLAIMILYGRVKNIALLFIIGALLTVVLEYATSVALEQMFDMRWWDYSAHAFNINGRVSLSAAVIFATMVVLLIRLVHPRVEVLTEKIPNRIKVVLSVIFVSAIGFDLSITIINLHNTGY